MCRVSYRILSFGREGGGGGILKCSVGVEGVYSTGGSGSMLPQIFFFNRCPEINSGDSSQFEKGLNC